MLVFDWLEQTFKIGWNILPARMTCAELCSQIVWEHFPQLYVKISALKEAIGQYVYDNTIFLKWGILNVPFCSIFVQFHFYLIMTLVVPFQITYLWFADLCTCKNWCDETYFFLFWFPQGGGGGFVRAWAWFVIIEQFIY